MVTDLTMEWQAIGAKPIRADAPAGNPVRDDADFLSMQDEIQKLESLSHEQVNWRQVVAGGRIVLADKSKDLLAAAYACLGLLHEEGIPGLAAGLACLRDMLARYWDSLYPEAKRVQKRMDVLVWLEGRLQTAFGERGFSSHDLDPLRTCEELLRVLETLLVEKAADKAPGFAGLRNEIARQIEQLGQPEPKPEGKGQESHGAAGPPTTSGGPRSITTADDCRNALREAGDLIRRAALFARGQDSSLPWPYRLVRATMWATLQMPSPIDDGLSRIPPPTPHVVHRYQELYAKGVWAQLLEQIESQCPETPFWLDPHRMAARALGQLGASYRQAKTAMEDEVRTLIERLPELAGCRFSDDMPFADEETRQWIGALQGTTADVTDSERGGAIKPGLEGNRLDDLYVQAATLAEQGRLKEAIALLQNESAGSCSERERFLLRLDAAKLCLLAGHLKVALSQLEGLDEAIVRFALDAWEPTLSVDVWKTMWQVLQQLLKDARPPAAEWADRAEAVHRRISRVDMLSGLDMEGKHQSARVER
ncbi:MAG: type VI secretion system protein TssA [Nitrospira sp.]|uniref:ImpA domain protein n=1 Tax=Nitrospira defluvii TaxID=330214 RepID=A0ABN7M2K6_9BACT|nr:type VI secretion system protein TssA [Nitrospira defluvii]MCS6326511.1 type VI secretion system protein TssA [Nitrospira sp.]CAE6781947.1 ImpA domain protein [Nitrospira defluvii]